MFLIFVEIYRILSFFLALLVRINVEPSLEPPISNSKMSWYLPHTGYVKQRQCKSRHATQSMPPIGLAFGSNQNNQFSSSVPTQVWSPENSDRSVLNEEEYIYIYIFLLGPSYVYSVPRLFRLTEPSNRNLIC
jgi:hypothetical protein